jgi:hypothetical protein
VRYTAAYSATGSAPSLPIKKDWPAHRKGVIQLGGEHRLQVMREQLLGFESTGKSQEMLHTEVLKYFNTMIGHREYRLSGVTASIPTVLWYVSPSAPLSISHSCGCFI